MARGGLDGAGKRGWKRGAAGPQGAQLVLYLLVEHLDQLDDSRVGAQPPQGLNLPQIVHLLLALECALHAFYGRHFAILHALSLEHLRESPLPFLRDQSILFIEIGKFVSQLPKSRIQ